MITDMPRPRPPYLSRERTRHGKSVWYVRREGKRIRLRAEYGSPQFQAEYQTALAATVRETGVVSSANAGTLAWLIERYRETHAWRSLSPATRYKREQILRQVRKTAGEAEIGEITPATIREGRERRAQTPGQATHFLYTMRGLFSWALDAQMVHMDPTVGIKNRPKARIRLSSLD